MHFLSFSVSDHVEVYTDTKSKNSWREIGEAVTCGHEDIMAASFWLARF